MFRKVFLALIGLLFLGSCKEPEVAFDQPQPANQTDLSQFPTAMRGKYGNGNENEILYISANSIYKTYFLTDTISVKDIPAFERIESNQIVHLPTGTKYPITRISDSLITGYRQNDTLFTIGPKQILRKWKGRYFLNDALASNNWKVEELRLQKGILRFNAINSKEKLLQLAEFATHDSTPTVRVSPTPRAFREFVRANGFETNYTYIKLP